MSKRLQSKPRAASKADASAVTPPRAHQLTLLSAIKRVADRTRKSAGQRATSPSKRRSTTPSRLEALKSRSEHGGDIRKGQRKLSRPFDTKRPLHLTLRSSKAKGPLSMLAPAHAPRVEALILKTARQARVRVWRFSNVGNHLHLVIQAPSRPAFQKFTRALPGLIARAVTGACKGNPFGKFWDKLIYSRLVAWGRDYTKLVRLYLPKNDLEALGRIDRPTRVHHVSSPTGFLRRANSSTFF